MEGVLDSNNAAESIVDSLTSGVESSVGVEMEIIGGSSEVSNDQQQKLAFFRSLGLMTHSEFATLKALQTSHSCMTRTRARKLVVAETRQKEGAEEGKYMAMNVEVNTLSHNVSDKVPNESNLKGKKLFESKNAHMELPKRSSILEGQDKSALKKGRRRSIATVKKQETKISSRRYRTYTSSDLIDAIAAVTDTELYPKEARKKYNVPERTIYDKLKKAGYDVAELTKKIRQKRKLEKRSEASKALAINDQC